MHAGGRCVKGYIEVITVHCSTLPKFMKEGETSHMGSVLNEILDSNSFSTRIESSSMSWNEVLIGSLKSKYRFAVVLKGQIDIILNAFSYRQPISSSLRQNVGIIFLEKICIYFPDKMKIDMNAL